MEKINTEIVISSLFASGFDQVDALLYTFVLGQLSLDNQELKCFEFCDEPLSEQFNKSVDYNGVVFKLKEGESLQSSGRLVEYLSQLNFRKIVLRKISSLYYEDLDNFDLLFSSKEKKIIHEMFGLSKLPHKTSDISSFDSFEVFKRMMVNINDRLTSEQDDDLRNKRYEMCVKQRQEEISIARK